MHNQQYMKIDGERGLVYDAHTNGVIDTDREAYQRYLDQKRRKYEQQDRLNRLETRINNIDTDLTEIKHLLTRLLERQHGHNN
jgi:hypothetical protein